MARPTSFHIKACCHVLCELKRRNEALRECGQDRHTVALAAEYQVVAASRSKVPAEFHRRHFYSATTTSTTLRELGVCPEKIATPTIEPGSVVSQVTC